MPKRPTAAEYWCDVIARRPLINTNSNAQLPRLETQRSLHHTTSRPRPRLRLRWWWCWRERNRVPHSTFALYKRNTGILFNCSGFLSPHLHHYHFGLESCVKYLPSNRSNSITICRTYCTESHLMHFLYRLLWAMAFLHRMHMHRNTMIRFTAQIFGILHHLQLWHCKIVLQKLWNYINCIEAKRREFLWCRSIFYSGHLANKHFSGSFMVAFFGGFKL